MVDDQEALIWSYTIPLRWRNGTVQAESSLTLDDRTSDNPIA